MKRKTITILLTGIILVTLLYGTLVNVLVSAALVPSFMETLDAFEEITQKSYNEQVQSKNLSKNKKKMLNHTVDWLDEMKKEKRLTKLDMKSRDGYDLVASRFINEKKSNKWVVLLHGYTGWKEAMYSYACHYYEEGYNVLVPDLRCQGESDGDFIGMGYTDSIDAIDWMNKAILKDYPDAQIVLHGQSMGGATALLMSGRKELPKNVVAVVSDCAYSDAYAMFEDKAEDWFKVPADLVLDAAVFFLKLRGGYDLRQASPIEAVKKSTTPTIFIHGDKDKMVPVEMATQMYKVENAEKELRIIPGVGHAQARDKSPEVFYRMIDDFLEDKVD
ncbi:MAG: alpha/beta fold hydrolase [Lachnospiraceae bacterium]|nr:alpha/beta fold hydrolase [Lachnospiraceae bacterium]